MVDIVAVIAEILSVVRLIVITMLATAALALVVGVSVASWALLAIRAGIIASIIVELSPAVFGVMTVSLAAFALGVAAVIRTVSASSTSSAAPTASTGLPGAILEGLTDIALVAACFCCGLTVGAGRCCGQCRARYHGGRWRCWPVQCVASTR